MKTLFMENEMTYDGSQLRSHFAFRQFGLQGDSCVAFIGQGSVELDAMVDLEDVRKRAPIFSPKMLHFIIELFGMDLKSAVLLQRLCVAGFKEWLEGHGAKDLRRTGDDLYLGDKKLSVSIAAPSPVSALIHIGLNVHTEGTPVPTVGLAELGIDAAEMARQGLAQISREYGEVLLATCKVRGVV